MPLPFAPVVILIQASLLVAVQLHTVALVTTTPPVPPLAAKFWLVGLIEKVHGIGVGDGVGVGVT